MSESSSSPPPCPRTVFSGQNRSRLSVERLRSRCLQRLGRKCMMGRECPPTSLSMVVTVESESLRTLQLSGLAEARWLNEFRAAFDGRRVWWEKTDSDVFGRFTPWRVPGNIPLEKSTSRLAAMSAAASVFNRGDESTSSPRAGRATGRSVLVGHSNAWDCVSPGVCWTYSTDKCFGRGRARKSGAQKQSQLVLAQARTCG